MNSWFYLIYAVLLVAAFLIYFRLANRYSIVDLPNHRTMHEVATIRGGGIVILLAVILFSIFFESPGYYFISGMVILGIVGFLDDLVDLPGKVRFPIQVLSIVLILYELNLLELHFILLFVVIVLAVGTLNAFNFMDGINGITGGYGLVTIISLLFVNNYIHNFIENDFLLFFILSLVVFNFYNFRNKAVCFAGDVGSLTVAYIIVYLIIKLVNETHQLVYLLFLTLYGIDTIFTIIQRILNKENIFEAHRLHLFQVAVHKTGMPQLRMSGIYMVVQAIINILVIWLILVNIKFQIIYSVVLLLTLSIFYVVVKRKMTQKSS